MLLWLISCMVGNGGILWKLSVSVTVNIHNRTATFHLEQIFIPCPLTPKFLTAPFPGRVLPEGWRKFHQFSSRAGTRKRPWWSPSTTGCSRMINLNFKLQLAGVKGRWWMCSTAPRWQSFGRFLPLMMCSDLIFVIFSPQMFLGSIFLHMKARKLWRDFPNFE